MLTGFLAGVTLLAATAAPATTAGAGVAAQTLGQQVRAAELPELEQIGATSAWGGGRGAGVTVGVVDTGTDGTVPDLAGSVTSGPDFITGIDPAGYQPPRLHGTFTASLIAGHGSGPGDTEGVIGVAPAAHVVAVRVVPDDNEPGVGVYRSQSRFAAAVARGVRYVVDHGARVINMSLGGGDPTGVLRTALGYAISHDVVVVAAAGNDGGGHSRFSPYAYPASYPGVISVAALDSAGRRASFSERNASVEISAPGVNVVGAVPGGQYVEAQGTSASAALVSGVAALIVSRYPRLSPALVEQAIVTSATRKPSGGYSPSTGFGEVSAPAALTAAGRLAGVRTEHGANPGHRFVASLPPPIQVTHRDSAKVTRYTAIAGGLGAGFLVFAGYGLLAFRNRRRQGAEEDSLDLPATSL